MSVSPEQQLRAYVDYLRDLGIYDLYRRDEPAVELPESLRNALSAKAAQASVATPRPAVFTSAVPPPPTRPAAPISPPQPPLAARPAVSAPAPAPSAPT